MNKSELGGPTPNLETPRQVRERVFKERQDRILGALERSHIAQWNICNRRAMDVGLHITYSDLAGCFTLSTPSIGPFDKVGNYATLASLQSGIEDWAENLRNSRAPSGAL